MDSVWYSLKRRGRRVGTSVSELRRIFEEGITVRAIAEPLQYCVSAEDSAVVRMRMAELQFDVLGFRTGEAGPIQAFVEGVRLCGAPLVEVAEPLGPAHLLADSTPLIEVLPALRRDQRRFILSAGAVSGIVTRADLQKPPIRLLIFGMISLLELHLSHLVRRAFAEGEWTRELTEARLDKLRGVLQSRTVRGEEVDLFACLQFGDKRKLVFKREPGRKALSSPSVKKGRELLQDIEALRDRVAHSQSLVLGTSWEDVIELVGYTEQFIQRCEELDKLGMDRAPRP